LFIDSDDSINFHEFVNQSSEPGNFSRNYGIATPLEPRHLAAGEPKDPRPFPCL
jgi:hypothetical protein